MTATRCFDVIRMDLVVIFLYVVLCLLYFAGLSFIKLAYVITGYRLFVHNKMSIHTQKKKLKQRV